jgi:hypothetical protein
MLLPAPEINWNVVHTTLEDNFSNSLGECRKNLP